jgi:hypothetical protein
VNRRYFKPHPWDRYGRRSSRWWDGLVEFWVPVAVLVAVLAGIVLTVEVVHAGELTIGLIVFGVLAAVWLCASTLERRGRADRDE